MEFACSRLTAHRAIRELADEGLVERRRRAGTRVLPRNTSGVLIRIPLIRDEITARGYSYGHELLQRRHVEPPEDIAPMARDRSFENVGANQWLMDNVPYSHLEHEIQAIAASVSQAGHPGVGVGSPLLRIRRLTQWQGKGVTAATLLHPGPLFESRSEPRNPAGRRIDKPVARWQCIPNIW